MIGARPLEGGCQCGAVRWRADAAGSTLYACHCVDCRKRTGAGFALNRFVAAAGFSATGEAVAAALAKPEGTVIVQHACPRCQSRVWAQVEGQADSVTLRAGSSDDGAGDVPAYHLWVSHKLGWIGLPEGAVTHETQPRGAAEWQAFRALAGL